MSGLSELDQHSFKRVLVRNISLPLGVGVLTVVVFVFLVFYLLSVMNWVEHTERVIAKIYEASKLSVDLESGMRGFLITNDESFLSVYETSKPKRDAEMVALIGLASDNPIQVDRFKRIQGLHGQWDKFAQEMISLKHNMQDFQTVIRSGRGKAIFDEIRREFNDALNMEQRLRQERTDTSRLATKWTVGLFLFFSLSLSLLLALFGRRELLNLSGVYDAALQKHNEYAVFLQGQSWLKDGNGKLASQVTGQLTISMVANKTLEFLAHYLDIAVAAFYVQENDGSLRRVASYGFTRENEAIGQHFKLGEGLVGQAAQENRLLLIRDVPDNYLKVNSALGSGRPKNITIQPFANEGNVNGVLELGFMRSLEKRDTDFLELIAPSLGTSVRAAMYRQRLQDVLAETQQLNEELQVQQEELRTANEELEEQSRILEESQANLENQKAELEQINDQLAEQALMVDQKNAALYAAQTELRERAEDLQRASRYKSEFLANMSHELRTPLNSSLILAKMLSDNSKGNLDAEQVKFAETIYSAGNDLLNLINDILDISKVEAGKLELLPEPISLAKLANEMKMIFSPLAKQKNLDLSFHIEGTAPQSVVSDRQRVEQILKNLLSNAIKFTETGSVMLTISREAAANVSFAVQDSGIGIEGDQQDVIFEAFRQADGTTSRRYGGTGLGLSISRDLTKLLGGNIYVHSEAGKGSTFTLILPEQWSEKNSEINEPLIPPSQQLNLSSPVTEEPAKLVLPAFPDDRNSELQRSRTLLVIEDEPDFASILYDLAHEMQFRCLVAQGAEEGLTLATQFLPDAILLDMRLPDRSGLSVLQQLKENSKTRHIPVHIVSAGERTDAALQLGAIGYARKPTSREELKEVFHKLENKFTQKVKHVLLVEDDARQRDSIVHLIGDEDVEITAVEMGEEALKLLRTKVFDCMIIDLKLPDIQGNELLKRMATEDIRSFPPVIVYTGRNLTRAEESELMKYSRTIIIKGARSPERLIDEVTLFLHKVESKLSSEAQKMLKTVRSRDRVFEGRKILLVDDDVRNIFALTNALEQKGFTVEIGRDGFEAINKLNEVPDIDLVLMDVMMPGMDGLEATRRIRENARFQKLPIITITAKAMKDDQEQCINAGATDYLAKPLNLDRLYSLLRVWMPHLERYAE